MTNWRTNWKQDEKELLLRDLNNKKINVEEELRNIKEAIRELKKK